MNPQKILYICVFALLAFSSCKKDTYRALKTAEDDVTETNPAIHSLISANVNSNCGGYFAAIPTRYDSSLKTYPLILFMHGIGELGNGTTDLSKMTRAGLPKLINKNLFPASFTSGGKTYSFIVVCPQFKKWPTNDEVYSVLKYAVKKYRVDTTMIYMAGLSMGGGVTWNFSAQYGSSLAAAVPICGGSYPDDKRAAAIAGYDLPVWAFHNNDDPTVPVSFSTGYVSKINSHNPAVKARLTTWEKGGHDAWTKAFNPAYKENGMNIYEWMLQYRKGLKG